MQACAGGPQRGARPHDPRRRGRPPPGGWTSHRNVATAGRAGPPFCAGARHAPTYVATEVGTLLWPALVGDALQAALDEVGPAVPGARTPLRALVGRLMFPGGLTAASRHAGAEPLLTGRSRPYDESTLRRHARTFAAAGGVAAVAAQVEAQVHRAVGPTGTCVAHTDLFDQVVYTKKPAHAGPIGALNNRLLAAVYFGLTCVRPEGGPVLAYHVSWHKPASPLVEALQALHAAPARHTWLTAHVRRHTWDRGGNGVAVLQWACGQQIPYLTVANGRVYLSSQRGPTHQTVTGLPVFVRREVRVVGRGGPVGGPRRIVFPTRAADGPACKHGLRFPTNARLTDAEIGALATVYKARWPEMENQIKALVGVGFGVNRARRQVVTTSRGVDGQLARLEARDQALEREIDALCASGEPATAAVDRKLEVRCRRQAAVHAQQEDLRAQPCTKGVRQPTATEVLCKYLQLLLCNVLVLALARSAVAAVRTLTPALVRELLLGRSALVCVEATVLTLWIDPVTDAHHAALQRELVRLFTEDVPLRLSGAKLVLRLRQPLGTRRT